MIALREPLQDDDEKLVPAIIDLVHPLDMMIRLEMSKKIEQPFEPRKP
jgi:hypothetical protein